MIGSDTCGIVVESGDTKFQKGDVVVSRFDEPKPVGGIAKFRLVKTELSEKAPRSISPVEACTLPASAMAAKVLATKFVKKGDRALILGGSGGVGTFLCQFCKFQESSFLAATSTITNLCTELGCDRVIDYRKENWWEIAEFQEQKFGVVLDLVNGENWKKGGCSGLALKRKGVFASLLTGVCTDFEVRGPFDVCAETRRSDVGTTTLDSIESVDPHMACTGRTRAESRRLGCVVSRCGRRPYQSDSRSSITLSIHRGRRSTGACSSEEHSRPWQGCRENCGRIAVIKMYIFT